MEYAVILFLLKTRRKPMRTIDQGFKYLFDARAGNGEAAQPLRSPSPKRSARQQDSARPAPSHAPAPPPASAAVTVGKQALVENIDAWAMWIAPPVFIFWNLCYWLAYHPWTNRLVSEDTLVGFSLTNMKRIKQTIFSWITCYKETSRSLINFVLVVGASMNSSKTWRYLLVALRICCLSKISIVAIFIFNVKRCKHCI